MVAGAAARLSTGLRVIGGVSKPRSPTSLDDQRQGPAEAGLERAACRSMRPRRGRADDLQLFAHPFSSYCQKVLIALWADETPFEYRMLDPDHPENFAELKERWPFGKFPLLVDDGGLGDRDDADHRASSCSPSREGSTGSRPATTGDRTRFLDRFFDIYVMTNMQKAGLDILRPEGSRDPYGVRAGPGGTAPGL